MLKGVLPSHAQHFASCSLPLLKLLELPGRIVLAEAARVPDLAAQCLQLLVRHAPAGATAGLLGHGGIHQLVAAIEACAHDGWKGGVAAPLTAGSGAPLALVDPQRLQRLQAILIAYLQQAMGSEGQAAVQAGVLPLLLAQPCKDRATLLRQMLQLPEGIKNLTTLVEEGKPALDQLAAMCAVAPNEAYTALLQVCQHAPLQLFASQVTRVPAMQLLLASFLVCVPEAVLQSRVLSPAR